MDLIGERIPEKGSHYQESLASGVHQSSFFEFYPNQHVALNTETHQLERHPSAKQEACG